MRYVSATMKEDLAEKLKTEIEECDWSMLAPLHKNELVLFIDQKLELITVGKAIAEDNVALVKIWQDNEEISRPSAKQVEEFEKEPHKKIAKFLIIQPYVLVKLLGGEQ